MSPPSLWMPMKPEEMVHWVVSFMNLPLMQAFTSWPGQMTWQVFHSPTGFSAAGPCLGNGVLASVP